VREGSRDPKRGYFCKKRFLRNSLRILETQNGLFLSLRGSEFGLSEGSFRPRKRSALALLALLATLFSRVRERKICWRVGNVNLLLRKTLTTFALTLSTTTIQHKTETLSREREKDSNDVLRLAALAPLRGAFPCGAFSPASSSPRGLADAFLATQGSPRV
jgi:hypothetical protein